jgi:hypothetical protein
VSEAPFDEIRAAERRTLEVFVRSERRSRYLTLHDNPRRRSKLLDRFCHVLVDDLDQRWVVTLPTAEHRAASVAEHLRRRGAPEECTVFGGELDGVRGRLDDVLPQLIGWGGGAIVVCLPGQLAFYEVEDPGVRFILDARARR